MSRVSRKTSHQLNEPRTALINGRFFEKWSREMAYVLGYFAADGSMYTSARGAHYIDFTSTDRALIYRVRRVMGARQKIKRFCPRNGSGRPYYHLQIGNKVMFHDLLKRGMTPRKSKAIKWPTVPKKYLPHFVRGYFDGDGKVYLRRHSRKGSRNKRWVFQVKFTSGSRQFLEGLMNTLMIFTYGGFISDRKSAYDLVYSHRDGLALADFMFGDVGLSGLCLARKFAIFKKAGILIGK